MLWQSRIRIQMWQSFEDYSVTDSDCIAVLKCCIAEVPLRTGLIYAS